MPLSMDFRFAHRSHTSSADARPWLRGACLVLLAIVLVSPCLAACGRPGGRVQVVSVDERLDIELGDGRTVRLGGLEAPNADHGAPETANNAREFLAERLLGREVDVMHFAGGPDRWGRTVAVLVVVDPRDGSAGSTA